MYTLTRNVFETFHSYFNFGYFKSANICISIIKFSILILHSIDIESDCEK